MAVASWMLAYKHYTGKYPGNDKRARLFEVPANHADRYSKLGRARRGNGPETGYIKTTAWNPLAMRGARALGIKGAVDTKLAGGTNWQALEAAEKDVLNTRGHPFLGPIPKALTAGLFGVEPYVMIVLPRLTPNPVVTIEKADVRRRTPSLMVNLAPPAVLAGFHPA